MSTNEHPVGMTLTQFLAAQADQRGDERSALHTLLADVAGACQRVSALVRRGELAGVLGAAGSENVQGEDQKKLDIIANDVFIESLEQSGCLAAMASEEMDAHYAIPDGFTKGDYLIAFDPLDGSSNIDVNGSTGTIFSITRAPGAGPSKDEDFLQPGRDQICAGYCLYSSATMLVLTLGNGVAGFTLEDGMDEFVLSHPNMRVPESTSEFAINAAYQRHWYPPVMRYIDECVAGKTGTRGRDFNMRWAGSMVGDVHRILCRGGVFLYPVDAKLEASGQAGKLRLLYEAGPMGLLVEQAGGRAHTGLTPILDVQPDGLHQRVPVFMGSAEEVDRLVEYHREA